MQHHATFTDRKLNISYAPSPSPLHTSYTKPKGQLPDYTTPVVLQQGKSSVEDLCNNIHKGIMREFKQ